MSENIQLTECAIQYNILSNVWQKKDSKTTCRIHDLRQMLKHSGSWFCFVDADLLSMGRISRTWITNTRAEKRCHYTGAWPETWVTYIDALVKLNHPRTETRCRYTGTWPGTWVTNIDALGSMRSRSSNNVWLKINDPNKLPYGKLSCLLKFLVSETFHRSG